jgi:hypothetical protein
MKKPEFSIDDKVSKSDIIRAGYKLQQSVGNFDIYQKDKFCLIAYQLNPLYNDCKIYLSYQGIYRCQKDFER